MIDEFLGENATSTAANPSQQATAMTAIVTISHRVVIRFVAIVLASEPNAIEVTSGLIEGLLLYCDDGYGDLHERIVTLSSGGRIS